MPRIAENSKSLVSDLAARLGRIVAVANAEGREEALAEVRRVVGGGTPVRRGPGRPRGSKNKPAAAPKTGKKRKNSWAGLSPAARLQRVNAIRKGRGLPPKTA